MSDRPTESLLRELTRDLEPVRRVARLRHAALGAVAVWALAVAAQAAWSGPLPFRVPGIAWGDPAFLAVLAGLIAAASGAVTAALAGAVPGREFAARRGRAVALLGVLVASLGGVGAGLRAELTAAQGALESGLLCTGRASALALVPAVFLCVTLARAYERRPLWGASYASLGAMALGALAVHTSCNAAGPLHLLLGHSLTPFAVALVLALPLSVVLRRVSRSA